MFPLECLYSNFWITDNSMVVWVCTGSVGLILSDVRFGMVSLDYVTFIEVPAK